MDWIKLADLLVISIKIRLGSLFASTVNLVIFQLMQLLFKFESQDLKI